MRERRHPELEVIYDGHCPFCSSYVAYCRLKDAFPDAILTNARDIPDRVAEFRGRNMDINKGMIVIYGGAEYYGDKAMAILSKITRPDSCLQRMLRSLFKWPAVAGIVYRVMRSGRDLTLMLLGRKKID